MSDVCICNVCNCGRHKCPVPTHQNLHYDPDALQTGYQRDFPRHPVDRTASTQRRREVGPGLPFEGESTSRADFPHYDANAYARPCPLDRTAPRESIPFEGSTTHHDAYQPLPIERTRSSAPDRTYKGNPIPFEGESTSRSDFPRYNPADYAGAGPRDSKAAPRESIPFEGSTTHHDAYQPLPIERTRSSAPDRTYKGNPIPFEGESTSRSDFPRYNPADYASGPRENKAVARESIPFEGSTTHHDAYQPLPIERTRSAAPDRKYKGNPIPFEGESTSHGDFARYDPASYARPEARDMRTAKESIPFEGSTTHHDAYQPLPIERTRSSAPDRTYKGNPIPFEGESTSRSDFPRYNPADYAGAGPRDSKAAPRESIPFEGSTTHHDAFQPLPIERTRSSAPDRTYKGNPIPFEGESTSHASFPKHERDVCPATLLAPHPKAADGHMYYSRSEVNAVSPKKKW